MLRDLMVVMVMTPCVLLGQSVSGGHDDLLVKKISAIIKAGRLLQ